MGGDDRGHIRQVARVLRATVPLDIGGAATSGRRNENRRLMRSELSANPPTLMAQS
jgi:hypothetical protein